MLLFKPGLISGLLALAVATSLPAQTDDLFEMVENNFWADEVGRNVFPPVEERAPQVPLIVELEGKGRVIGQEGGTLRTMVTRSKDIRQMVVYGYARLVIYDHEYNLVPDILLGFDVEENRKFTLRLRPGHRWSNGDFLTSADFRYWWEDVANNKELSPSGPPEFIRAHGALPKVSFPDDYTIVYEWPEPNPRFLQLLAQASPPFIYRPVKYLKQFHIKYADPAKLKKAISRKKVRSWASLHNKLDNMYKFDNPSLPTLQPWISAGEGQGGRQLFVRNAYYHRFDKDGTQLPYIDIVEMNIVGNGLVAAKSNAGEVDIQARGLDFKDVPILKKGEVEGGNYRTLLWVNGSASQIAIYPNLNYLDPAWRNIIRDVRFRRALSIAIDRRMINRALYFGLGFPGSMAALPASPFYAPENRIAWARLNLEKASQLLDEMGLTDRTSDGIRLLPDGRPMRFVIETAGERQEVENALQIVTDTWREIGINLIVRPLDRDILRKHVNTGTAMASVWYGWDNGIPSDYTSPAYLSPRQQEFFAWPKWGQYYQTGGEAGEPPDMELPGKLLQLAEKWENATSKRQRELIWREMLDIHANQVYAIGILSGAPQPVVVSRRLRNVPQKGIWAWEPGSHFGIHRMDEFFFADEGDS